MQQTNIYRYKHSFMIEGVEIELTISRIAGHWKCQVTKGKTGISISSGGQYDSLEEYVKEQEAKNRHSYLFLKYGYKLSV